MVDVGRTSPGEVPWASVVMVSLSIAEAMAAQGAAYVFPGPTSRVPADAAVARKSVAGVQGGCA